MTTYPLPHVHVLHPAGTLQCSTYAVVGDDGAIMIDPGGGLYQDDIIERLDAAVTGGTRSVRAILLTHPHVDHVLGADRLARYLNAPLWASVETADRLERGDPRIWIENTAFIRPMRVDRCLEDGEQLDLGSISVRCLNTPGHTAACMSFVVQTDRGLTAFTGDLLMADPRRLGWAGSPDFSESATMKSLERLEPLELNCVFTGHGAAPADVGAWVRQGIEHGRRGEWLLKRQSGAPDVPEELVTLYRRKGWVQPDLARAAGD